MNDDRRTTDERIAATARELYHEPPRTPRDEMWAEIEARLDASASAKGQAAGGASAARGARVAGEPADERDSAGPAVVRLDDVRPRFSARTGWWIGIAAALLIGLGIGRLSMSTDSADPRLAGGADDAERTVATAPAGAPAGDAEGGEAPGVDAGVPAPEDGASRLADGRRDPRTRETAPAGTEGRPGVAVEDADAGAEDADVRAPGATRDGGGSREAQSYAVAARRHLDRSETFLAGLAAAPAFESPNPEFEAWARSLLTRTRVLMASPAGRDRETRRLLEDLELMLAQIAVTAATGDSGEARILGRGLEEGNLLYRLRSATGGESGAGTARTDGTSSL